MPVKFSKCSRLLKVHVIKLFNSIQIPIIYSDSSIYSTSSQVHAKKLFSIQMNVVCNTPLEVMEPCDF